MKTYFELLDQYTLDIISELTASHYLNGVIEHLLSPGRARMIEEVGRTKSVELQVKYKSLMDDSRDYDKLYFAVIHHEHGVYELLRSRVKDYVSFAYIALGVGNLRIFNSLFKRYTLEKNLLYKFAKFSDNLQVAANCVDGGVIDKRYYFSMEESMLRLFNEGEGGKDWNSMLRESLLQRDEDRAISVILRGAFDFRDIIEKSALEDIESLNMLTLKVEMMRME